MVNKELAPRSTLEPISLPDADRDALAEAEETKDVYENFSRRDVLAFAMVVFISVILVGLPLWAAITLLSGK